MSHAEIDRFFADLQSNAALRAEAEKSQAAKSHAPSLDQAVAFAVGKGYRFTADQARQFVKQNASAAGKVLTDADLDGVAAGSGGLPGGGFPLGGIPCFNAVCF
jgi:hypothetical protein